MKSVPIQPFNIQAQPVHDVRNISHVQVLQDLRGSAANSLQKIYRAKKWFLIHSFELKLSLLPWSTGADVKLIIPSGTGLTGNIPVSRAVIL